MPKAAQRLLQFAYSAHFAHFSINDFLGKTSFVSGFPAKSSNVTVSKKCVLAPCFLDELGMDKSCDMSRDSFTCVSCCNKNGCNTATGSATPSLVLAILVPAAVFLAGLDRSKLAIFRRRLCS